MGKSLKMNDFTKDELRHIGDAIFYSLTILPERIEALMSVRGKVLAMIDNYCEHDPGYYVTPDENILTCHKCKKRLHKSKELRLIE